MSESDDTDILLLIPPDLFTVASSASEESLPNALYSEDKKVSSLFDQVQMLENRMSAIEIKDPLLSSLSSLSRRFDISTEAFDSSRTQKSPKKPLNLSFLSSDNFDQLSPLNLKTKNSDKIIDYGSLNNSNSIPEKSRKKIRDNYYKDNNKIKKDVGVNTDFTDFSHKLLSLSDFWDPDPSRSEMDRLRIKNEEEKFRREHCEKIIQELQSRLLEQQEKVAVAIGIDNEKKSIIDQYQSITKKLKNQIQLLQNNYKKLDENFCELKTNSEVEINNLKLEIKTTEEELGNSRELLKDLRGKIDGNLEEKLGLLESHANELDNYKLLIEKSEKNYEKLKLDYEKTLEKNLELENLLSTVQQDFYREKLKSGEIRSEMGMIHKALDTCEAELTVLRQEKENLLIKLKEEENRLEILEQKRRKTLEDLNSVKESEERGKEEINRLIEQSEKIRSELREIYQNQVDDVVNVKLKEFQGQLDAAEAAFNTELDAKQRAIAECAAGKIKSIIDKHQLEINLIEEKHREEKRLYELRLSQVVKRMNLLEGKLKAQENAKSRIVEQLHVLMEKQWKQAVEIISSGNDGGFENLDYSRELRGLIHGNRDEVGCMEPVRLRSEKRFCSHQEHNESVVTVGSNEGGSKEARDDLKKYIKMILQMQESKKFSGTHGENESSVSSSECRQVPRKYYTKADATSVSEKTVTWEETEPSTIFNGLSMTQIDSKPSKPPWK